MSQIPIFGGSSNRPIVNISSTVTSKTPTGGSKTITNTIIKELVPGATVAQNKSRSVPCASNRSGYQSLKPPPAGRSGTNISLIPPPIGTSSMLRPPQATGISKRIPAGTSTSRGSMESDQYPSGMTKFGYGGKSGTCPGKSKKVKHKTPKLPLLVNFSSSELHIYNMKSHEKKRIFELTYRNVHSKRENWEKLPKITKVLCCPRKIAQELGEFAKISPITPMSRFEEKLIKTKIQLGNLENRFPWLLKEIMNEAKLEFQKISLQAGLNSKVKRKNVDYVKTV
ncbi:hypothetical protein ABEB36_003584 [Hypothenemus hampei]|uniref:Uncharacterized protein n=1 Tax=Hypothenemus hampei TaxID=57062 RepID=A0ABD1F9N7_HYPHA